MRTTDIATLGDKTNALEDLESLFRDSGDSSGHLLTLIVMIEDSNTIQDITKIIDNFQVYGTQKISISDEKEVYGLRQNAQDIYFSYIQYQKELSKNAQIEAQREAQRKVKQIAEQKAEQIAEQKALRKAKKKEFKAGEREKREAEEKAQKEAKKKLEEESLAREAKEKAEREAKEKAEKLAEKQLKAEERRRRFLEAQSKENPKTKSGIQNQVDIDEIQEKARKEEQEKAKKQAQEEAKKKVEEQARKEAEEKAKQKAEEQAKIEAEEREKAEKKALKEKIAQERKDRYEKAKTIKSQVIKKGQENFEKFQPFFDFLRSKEYFDIGEIGFFGSRVYKEVLGKALDREIIKNPNADFDFYCLPKSADSLGVFRIYQDELGSKINFSSLLTEFNERNPNMQIQLIEDVNAKKSVNYGKGGEKSLNFKLVATFFDDKVAGEKSEKIIKEQIEFDLNFYTQQSALQKLQWQINLERLMLTRGLDRVTDLKLNQSNCESSQDVTTEKFIFEALGEKGKNFLTKFNPNANKFLDRIVNKKGVYKYLEDQELDEIKAKLVKDHRLALEREFEEYKKFLSINKTLGKNPSIDAKITEYGKIIEAVKKDPILKTLEEEISLAPQSPRSANATQVLDNARTR